MPFDGTEVIFESGQRLNKKVLQLKLCELRVVPIPLIWYVVLHLEESKR